MSFPVAFSLQWEFTTSSAPDQVFALLADVPRSASHFPKVGQLVDLGGNTYRWEMEKIGIGGYTLQQTIYACRYSADAAALQVGWTPVAGVGNGIVEGGWQVTPNAGGSTVTFTTKGELSVDFPSFLQFIIAPLVQLEFTGLIESYIKNLQESFSKL